MPEVRLDVPEDRSVAAVEEGRPQLCENQRVSKTSVYLDIQDFGVPGSYLLQERHPCGKAADRVSQVAVAGRVLDEEQPEIVLGGT